MCRVSGNTLATVVATGVLIAPLPGFAQTSQDFPSKPIRFIVPFVAGAGTDTTARTVAQKLSERWGQQVVVDNRSGAGGAIGVDLTAKAVPDGYTICLITAGSTVNSATNPKLPYDLTKDLQAITQATSTFLVLYHHPSLPVKSVKELIAYSKANPNKLHFGSSGTGGFQHFAGEMFNHLSGARLVHVPYKGGAAVITAMLSGDVQVGFGTLLSLRPHMPSGRVRVLAVSAKKRSPAAPELPTIAEAGVAGYEVDQWFGVITSAKVSPAIIRKLNGGIVEALKAPDVVRRLEVDGLTPVSSSPEEFGAHINSEISKWRKLVNDTGLVLH